MSRHLLLTSATPLYILYNLTSLQSLYNLSIFYISSITYHLSAQDEVEIPMINVPGQRFTATHGIKAKRGESKLFL